MPHTPPQSDRNKSLEPLNGLRFFAFLPIFFLHATGNRDLWLNFTLVALDFFFVLAGYMAAVGHYGLVPKSSGELARYSLIYVKKKIDAFYPLHITMFVLLVPMLFLAPQFAGYAPENAFDGSWKAGMNLLLLQAWSWARDVKFSYNGVSWFLSTLMFCFLLTPLLLRTLEWAAMRFGNWSVLAVAIIAALIKLPLYIFDADMRLSTDVTEIFIFDAHSWPPFRLMDFSVGLCAGAWWKMRSSAQKPERHSESPCCFLFAMSAAAVMGYDWLPQPVVLLVLAGGIYGVSISGCLLVRLFRSRVLLVLGSLVMPVFLLHNVLIKYVRWADISVHRHSVALLVLVLSFMLGFGWLVVEKKTRKFVKRRI